MGSNEINNFDNLIRQQMENFKPSPPPEVWSGVEQSASSSSASGILSKAIGKWMIGAAIVATSAVAYYQVSNKETSNTTPQIVQQSNTNIAPSTIDLTAEKETSQSKSIETTNGSENGSDISPISKSSMPTPTPKNSSDSKVLNAVNTSPKNEQPSQKPILNIQGTAVDLSPASMHITIDGASVTCMGAKQVYKIIGAAKGVKLYYVGSNDDSADHLLSESESHEFTKVWDAEGNYTLLAKDQQNHVLASKEILIQKLNASFQYNMRMYPEIAFNAQSNDPEAELTWQFGDEEAAVGKEVIHRFAVPRDSQNYQVKLIAWTSAGCKTECQLPLTLYAANEPIIPNVFTPDGDRLNDKFEIMMQGNKFIALQILNQDQQLIFETKDMNQPWDGMIGGKPAERGTYYYRLIYQTATNDKPTIVSNTLFLQRGN